MRDLHVLKLYKWYQIAQSVINELPSKVFLSNVPLTAEPTLVQCHVFMPPENITKP